MSDSAWSDAASWVQAVGTIGAVIGAAWMAAADSRASRRREEHARQEARRREEQAALASKTAALNLAILASTQIHDLHVLLRDEARRGRVARVSPSRTLLATERLVTAFPIQSLNDADAMVAFSRFPGALATAGEIFGHLETAIRATGDTDRAAIFTDYAKQMGRLDELAKRWLKELRQALALEAPKSAGKPG
jgi:hypothetical protein